jgi:hypothetical protein
MAGAELMARPTSPPLPRRPKVAIVRSALPEAAAREAVARARTDHAAHGAPDAVGSELRPDADRVTPRVSPLRLRKLLGR